eukprot:CAMPEP_0172517578 /NCGR_PEP_ID=MMETSP1066-20121228/286246_1 /TAXON_ID=671091 /ORGANISM="Coscinodiscus wailesii, Strain CCMP2513" /LENGTH=1458 /DNA_ID=CAMNT_0013299657 /DNA_START=234 /DNA_END=4610 /DNA_ORIENTATION=+
MKENAAPLERGRNIKTLMKKSIALSDADRHRANKQKKHYERLVRDTEDNSVDVEGDPLVHWLSYIKFVQETFPSDTQATFLLLERCARALLNDPRYQNDVRFIRVCILYADKTSTPMDIFKFLHQKKVGSKTALFWVAWAWVAEKAGDYSFAEKVFLKAKDKGAKPTKLLEERHIHFQRRMSRHWLNSNSDNHNSVEGEQEEKRETLAPLSRHGARYNQRSRGDNIEYTIDENTGQRVPLRQGNGAISRSSSRSSNRQTSRNNGRNTVNARPKSFSIFTEEDVDDDDYNLNQSYIENAGDQRRRRRKLEKESESRKENIMKEERWNVRGGLYSHSDSAGPAIDSTRPAPQAGSTFDVFVDEECAKGNNVSEESRKRDKRIDIEKSNVRSLRQRVEGGIADKLSRDPLRYIKNPSKVVSDQARIEKDGNKYEVKKGGSRDDENHGSRSIKSKKGAKGDLKVTSVTPLLQCGFNKELVGKDSNGQECCFEEARARAKYFKRMASSCNFNYLKETTDDSAMSITAETIEVDESVLMEDDNIHETLDIGNMNLNCSLNKSSETELYINETRNNVINQSSASSNLDETNAVGVIDDEKLEPTINTKFAMRELSMMFASPGMDKQNGKEANQSNAKPFLVFQDDGHTNNAEDENKGPSFNIFQDSTIYQEHHVLNNSITDAPGIHESNTAKKVAFSVFDESSATTVPAEAQQINVAMGGHKKRVLGEIRSDEVKSEVNKDSGFTIFRDASEVHDENIHVHSREAKMSHHETKSTFSIFQDCSEGCDTNKASPEKSIKKKCGDGGVEVSKKTSFAIFEDNAALGETQHTQKNGDCNEKVETKKTTFKIFTDGDVLSGNKFENVTNVNYASDEDTATFSMVGETLKNLTSKRSEKNETGATKGSIGKKTFAIFEDNCSSANDKSVGTPQNDADDTVSFSILDETNCGIGMQKTYNVKKHGKSNEGSNDTKRKQAFNIFCEDTEKAHVGNSATIADQKDSLNVSISHNTFGGISPIKSVHAEYPPKLGDGKPIDSLKPKDATDYKGLHEEDVIWALDRAMEEAAKNMVFDSNVSRDTYDWSGLFKNGGGPIGDRRSLALPKALIQKTPKKGSQIELAGSTARVRHELGRGAYGVVMLCDIISEGDSPRSSESNNIVALKVQVPTRCLAWEYHILNKIEERVPQNKSSSGLQKCRLRRDKRTSKEDFEGSPLPFPRPTYFAAYKNGAILGMTAGSTSGMTLVDVVNAHKISGGGPVPELIALHYTSRMLNRLESLHWHGKILHCDVKPDNWVLTDSKSACGTESTLVESSDLMLVDFGRAVDLTTVTEKRIDPLDIRLYGDIAAQDFSCAAMRENGSWGADADTYGLCASALALLYGSYVDTIKDPTSGRWILQKPLRRYWNKNIWNTLFDTLLNPNDTGKVGSHPSSGSHPNTLRAIRKDIEAYMESRQDEIVSLLRHQASILPKLR